MLALLAWIQFKAHNVLAVHLPVACYIFNADPSRHTDMKESKSNKKE